MSICVFLINGHVVMVRFHSSLLQCENPTSNLLPGQCITDSFTDRHRGDRVGSLHFCQNLRDVQYMCESARRSSSSWWTIDGGYCLPYQLAYQTLHLDTKLTEDTCNFFIRCALSDSLNEDCQCKNLTQCRNLINASCMTEFSVYPSQGAVISPYVYMVYERDRDWTNKKPDLLALGGQLKCLGYLFRTKEMLRASIGESFPFYAYKLIENALCGIEEGIYGYRNHSGPHYDVNCWNNSTTFNHRSYQVSFLCQTRCISKYRVRDGIQDCSFDEESSKINNSCPKIQRHRLQCSPSELTCLVVGAVGNGATNCGNKRDEIDYLTGTVLLGYTHCLGDDISGCNYLQNYIHMSSKSDVVDTMFSDDVVRDNHFKSVLPFRSYCDSFFHLDAGFDELPELCQEWSCLHEEYQCLSGQCIPLHWICDGIFPLIH